MNLDDLFENVIDASSKFKKSTDQKRIADTAQQHAAEEFVSDQLEEFKEKYLSKTLRYRMMVKPLFRRYGKEVDFFDVLFIALLDRDELAHRFLEAHRDELIELVEQYINDLNNLENEMSKMKVPNPENLYEKNRIDLKIYHLKRHLEYFKRNEW